MKWPRWLNPFNWLRRDVTVEQLVRLGFLPPAAAGINLTTEQALGVSAVFCADRVIAEDLATLPMMAYAGNRLDDGAKPLPNDPITALLAKPNPEQTGPVFWSCFQHNANVWGFGLAEIVRDGAGRPVELWPLCSPECRLERSGGYLQYWVPAGDGAQVQLDPFDVLFLPGFSPDGSCGFKLLHIARTTLGMAVAAQRYGLARFRNGLNPSGAIKHPGVLTDGARENMRASWRAMYGGPDAVGNPMILEEGTAWEGFKIDNNDQLQLAQLIDLLTTEVARFFNISPVKLHQLGRATWNNLEQLQKEHVITTLGPWIAKRDAEVDAKLSRPGTHCRHIVDRLMTADTATRFSAWNAAIAGGWMTPNEARKREDLPPLPGGDELLRPLNQAPAADNAGDNTDQAAAGDQAAGDTTNGTGTNPPGAA